MTALIFLGTLLSAIAIGMPIAFALLASGVAIMLVLGQFDAQIVVQNTIAGADNFVLMAVPFFILAGEFMNAGGLSKRIVDMAAAFVGHLRGGLGYVAIIAAVLLASLSGSAVADTAALAAILVPMMRSAGYNVGRACGLMAAGGITDNRTARAAHALGAEGVFAGSVFISTEESRVPQSVKERFYTIDWGK